jgi:hypothetical protein
MRILPPTRLPARSQTCHERRSKYLQAVDKIRLFIDAEALA